MRKVRLFLLEKGIDYQLEIITPFGQPAWYRELNPLGRIPAMRDGDFTLADSSVICQYLEDKHADLPPLYGRDAEQRARVRWLEKYADYELAPLTTFCVFRNRALKPTMGQPCDEAAVRGAAGQAAAAFRLPGKDAGRRRVLRWRRADPGGPGPVLPADQHGARHRAAG